MQARVRTQVLQETDGSKPSQIEHRKRKRRPTAGPEAVDASGPGGGNADVAVGGRGGQGASRDRDEGNVGNGRSTKDGISAKSPDKKVADEQEGAKQGKEGKEGKHSTVIAGCGHVGTKVKMQQRLKGGSSRQGQGG